MSVSDGFLALLQDQLSDLGTVTARRMFSGAGVYIDGVIFALVIDDVLYLKTDEESRAAFEAEGLEPFSFVKQSRRISTSYWRAPELLLDDRTELQRWAARALQAAKKSGARRTQAKRTSTMTTTTDPAWVGDVLHFWFDRLGRKSWFVKDAAIDAEIRDRFATLIDEINVREVEDAVSSPAHALATVLVLDQFSRNIYRGTSRAFAYDELARGITRLAIALGLDQRLPAERRVFLYMPFEHSEAYADQLRSVELIGALGDAEYTRYAEAHRDVIERFGRFPHRNAILGRASTPEEIAFLEQPGSSF